MNYPKIYAMIDESGTVHNRIVVDDYEEAIRSAKTAFGEDGQAVECNQYKIFAGWKYLDGEFYLPDGVTLAEHVPTEAEQILHLEELERAQKELSEEAAENNVELDYRLSMLELGL